jgi:hypothetical protein
MSTITVHADAQRASKLRMGAAILLGTIGLSVIGSLTPAIASADDLKGPNQPINCAPGPVSPPAQLAKYGYVQSQCGGNNRIPFPAHGGSYVPDSRGAR